MYSKINLSMYNVTFMYAFRDDHLAPDKKINVLFS